MAPPPEYDKEPKAPDKSAATIANDDSKLLHSIVNDQQTNSDHKPSNTTANSEVENNKQVVNLDDGQLRALLDEAMNYKCPKDLEGKSNLFKELLEEVEQQDDQASEAAVRGAGGARGARRSAGACGGGRSRHALHSNSLQDLVAALAAESAPRRPRHHALSHAPVSARAIQGGSLPSGVDTSFLLGEEGGGARYLATVRCVNPPPLAERRVSASDANSPSEVELLNNNRRSKPVFPMTYTARATLEIGSGSVCSGRAVTTTTASNQVRTPPRPSRDSAQDPSQAKLMNALHPKRYRTERNESIPPAEGKATKPRGPSIKSDLRGELSRQRPPDASRDPAPRQCYDPVSEMWTSGVNRWYEGLAAYGDAFQQIARGGPPQRRNQNACKSDGPEVSSTAHPSEVSKPSTTNADPNIKQNIAPGKSVHEQSKPPSSKKITMPILQPDSIKYIQKKKNANNVPKESLINRIVDETQELYRVDKKNSDIVDSDNRLRNDYPERIDYDVGLRYFDVNPRNIRKMTISTTPSTSNIGEPHQSLNVIQSSKVNDIIDSTISSNYKTALTKCATKVDKICKKDENYIDSDNNNVKDKSKDEGGTKDIEMIEIPKKIIGDLTDKTSKTETIIKEAAHSRIRTDKENNNDIELAEFVPKKHFNNCADFLEYFATQEKLFQALESADDCKTYDEDSQNSIMQENTCKDVDVEDLDSKNISTREDIKNNVTLETERELVLQFNKPNEKVSNDQYILAELPNNAYVFLTLPKRLLIPLDNQDQKSSLQIHEMQNNTNAQSNTSKDNTVAKVSNKKKKEKAVVIDDTKRKDAINKSALRVLLFENLKRDVSIKPMASTVAGEEGDSAIPFSCITTPEVVASCNTTASTPQSAVAVDPKPLQLASGYRAVASLTGAPPEPAPAPRPAAPPAPTQLQVFVPRLGLQPRSVISSSFNGLPLTRPNYGATAAPDDYKKSLDENGNAVQGFGSPVSGSGQHKKPRRKKSSKNETVIKSHQIDGYQGNKDLNEVLRFIESNADAGRGKLRKHDDDKHAKKRSAERRKPGPHAPPRASSLDDLSRTRRDLQPGPRPPPAPPKPERRSWGDAAPDPPDPTDFQTVTKRRRPRRRLDEPAPRRPRPPDPQPRPRRDSAPPSDRSNDSTDDLDSVHSLPPPPPPAPPQPHASYADIARTRHNIPDLIESCNFYAEGEAGDGGGGAAPSAEPAGGAGDADYPALGPRARKAVPRPVRKDRGKPPQPCDCPAPDVVGERRPAVILLDAGARPRDMDGVTFGFDINEQLLTGPPRRPRCDLVRDALELEGSTAVARTVVGETGAGVGAGVGVVAGGAVPVGVGACALRYVPPAPPPDTHHLHQIIDYVGSAWEDVVRCGSGKVRYFSE